MTPLSHRGETGRDYRGIPEHAAGGLHEYVVESLRRSVHAGARVLDVGAGSGALTARLSQSGFAVTAADVETTDYLAAAPIVSWDVTSVPLEGSWDAICAVEVLEHVENPLRALRNLWSMLGPGGVLLVTTPNLEHPKSRIKFLVRGAPSYFGPEEYLSLGHRTLLPAWLLRRHVEQVGLIVDSISFAGRMTLSPQMRWVWRLLSPFLAPMQSRPRKDDGCISVIVAHRP
jgi:SAM-dependent methyltransferase